MTLDTQRADFINAYNPGTIKTPNLDSLAESGIIYENCLCLIPTTLPSHASIFFSLPPNELKVYNNGQEIKKNRGWIPFTKIFKKHKYNTAAFVSLGVLKSRFGLNDGFDLYNDNFVPHRFYLTAEEINNKVLPWLEHNKDNQFFLWVHYSDPHEPYYPPQKKKELKILINGQLISEFFLKKTINTINLKLKKGNNQLLFKIRNYLVTDLNQAYAFFDKFNIQTLEKNDDVKIKFSANWRDHKKKGVFSCREKAVIEIFNPKQPRNIKFSFRGKIAIPLDQKRNNYKAEVEYMDKQIGSFLAKLKELGLYDKSHILVVGDHGEGLGDYEKIPGYPHFGHTHFIYTVYMKIPLILYSPNSTSRRMTIKEPVSLLDIAPTILNIMGFKSPSAYQGKNLLDIKTGYNKKIFMDAHRPLANKNKFGIYQYPWHLIFTPEEKKFEFFNLIDDPNEHNNIYNISPSPDTLSAMKKDLIDFTRKVLTEKGEIKIDKKNEQILRSLGYIK